MTPEQAAIESTVAGIANKTTYAGATGMVVGGLTANEIAMFGGLVVAVLGFLVNILFRLREDRRNTELHREQLARLRRQDST